MTSAVQYAAVAGGWAAATIGLVGLAAVACEGLYRAHQAVERRRERRRLAEQQRAWLRQVDSHRQAVERRLGQL